MSTSRFSDGELRVFDLRAFDGALGATGLRTITRLAKHAGVSRQTLYLVRGGWQPSVAMQAKIAAALSVDVATLWKVQS